jgi:hypothetical protein
MYRNGRSISHAGEAAESTTSARSPEASSTKPGNECWPRNRSPRRKIYKRQSIASFKAAWRPGGGPVEARGLADGRPSGREVKQQSGAKTHGHGICVARLDSSWARRSRLPTSLYPNSAQGLQIAANLNHRLHEPTGNAQTATCTRFHAPPPVVYRRAVGDGSWGGGKTLGIRCVDASVVGAEATRIRTAAGRLTPLR